MGVDDEGKIIIRSNETVVFPLFLSLHNRLERSRMYGSWWDQRTHCSAGGVGKSDNFGAGWEN